MNLRHLVYFFLIGIICTSVAQQQENKTVEIKEYWQPLLDEELINWEVFVGVPHISVDIDAPKSKNVHKGTPLGLNNDPKKVFSTYRDGDDIILKVSGEIYAGLTTKNEFENYHLKVKFKWGDKKWEPRLDLKRDNGILYHCHGEHGSFWNVWMSGLECQIQEGDTGDFVTLVHARADVVSSKIKDNLYKVTGDHDKTITYGAGDGNPGYCHIAAHNEKPNGEWNEVEVICVGDQSIHVVNGKVVMVVKNARKVINKKEQTLTKGKIQLQSEGAEAYYKDIQIKSVQEFPKVYRKQMGI